MLESKKVDICLVYARVKKVDVGLVYARVNKYIVCQETYSTKFYDAEFASISKCLYKVNNLLKNVNAKTILTYLKRTKLYTKL